MNIPTLIKNLNYNNIHFRPKGLKRLKELFGEILESKVAQQFLNFANEQQLEYLDVEDVEKLLDMIQYGLKKDQQDQAKIFIEKINKSIIFLDYFAAQQFQLQCTPADKQKMTLNRLANIEGLLRRDSRYVFGFFSNENLSISQIGSVIGSIDRVHCIVGILVKIGNFFYLSDGMINLRVNLINAKNQSLFTATNTQQASIGIVNEGSIVILQGEWNDHQSHFDVFNFAIPNFNLKKQLREEIKQSDLKQIKKLDTFGVFEKVKANQTIDETSSLERQKAFNFFFKADNDQMWVLSNFTLDNLIAIKNFETLLNQAQELRVKPPDAIFFVGQFSNAQIPNPEKLYGNELVKLVKQSNTYLQKTLLFFVPSYDDFPIAYSMPKTPINLRLYFEQPTEMMHAVCNPCKMSIRGYNVVLIRSDISKEIRRNHIQQMKSEHTHLCETIISQQYLGSFQSRKICYKWNYDHAMHLDPSVEVIILCDQTIDQFKYITIINETQIINPGNFQKGEFGTLKFNKKKQTISCDTSRVETS